MPGVNRTQEFKLQCSTSQTRYPPSNKRTKYSAPHAAPDTWTQQAEQVVTNLRTLSAFLSSVRRAYLDLSSSSSNTNQSTPRQRQPPSQQAGNSILSAWDGVKHLTNRDRDEIDYSVKLALRKSVDRVRELEQLEKVRLLQQKRTNPNAGLTRMLGLSGPSTASKEAATASHRTYITLHLNNLLAQVSKYQRDQQQERIRRVLEKTATLDALGSAASTSDSHDYSSGAATGSADSRRQPGGPAASKASTGQDRVGRVPSIYRPIPIANSGNNKSTTNGTTGGPLGDDDDDELLDVHDGLEELTQEMIQQFEAEESALLRATNTDLASLKQAESSLLEISALQTQLAMHLTQQGELTDKLWEEAVGVAGKVDEGNQQLKKAKERNKESRIILLMFLILASLTLLFLDYYG